MFACCGARSVSSSKKLDRKDLELRKIRDDKAEKEMLRLKSELQKLLSENSRLEVDLKSASSEIEERKKETDRLKHEAKLKVIENIQATKYNVIHHRNEEQTDDTTNKEMDEKHDEEEEIVIEDWSTGEFTRSRVVKKATTFGDGNLRTYDLTSDRIPHDTKSVRSTIWQSTANMCTSIKRDELKEMFGMLFKDFDEMFTPLSLEERKEMRQHGKKSSRRKTDSEVPTVKSQRVERVKIRAYVHTLSLS